MALEQEGNASGVAAKFWVACARRLSRRRCRPRPPHDPALDAPSPVRAAWTADRRGRPASHPEIAHAYPARLAWRLRWRRGIYCSPLPPGEGLGVSVRIPPPPRKRGDSLLPPEKPSSLARELRGGAKRRMRAWPAQAQWLRRHQRCNPQFHERARFFVQFSVPIQRVWRYARPSPDPTGAPPWPCGKNP